MPRPVQLTRDMLSRLLISRGPISATEIASILGVNRTTVVRALGGFGDDLVTLGASRNTRYLLRRPVRNANRWPIYLINESGRPTLWAELEALHESSWRIQWAGTPPQWAGHFTKENGLWLGFPFFLGDARPQGFLGRATTREVSRILQLPEDPRHWGDTDILVYLNESGIDLPGNHLIGENNLRNTLSRSANPPASSITEKSHRAQSYPALAEHAAATLPGSSAGGEQPKFLTTLRDRQGHLEAVLVKFTAPLDQPVAVRWADLLLAEFHAHQVLAEAGLGNPGCRLLDAGNRRFLEVPRFDRPGAIGRRGIVSLEALHAAAIGSNTNQWNKAAKELLDEGLIQPEAQRCIRQLSTFGEIIGNSDMHFGNLSFWLNDHLPFQLTPAYDMLPMLWAPAPQGELISRPFLPAPPLPGDEEIWREAAAWADTFWSRLLADERLSENFSPIAESARNTVSKLRQFVG